MNATPQTSITAVISMIFGLVAWCMLPFLGAIVAVVTGHIARSEIRHSEGRLEGDGMALAGLVLGWLQLGLAAVIVGAIAIFFGGFAFIAALAN